MANRRTRPAPPTFPLLSPTQEQAMELLVAGQRVRDIATALQLSPNEVDSWRQAHPVFVARLNQAKHRLWDESQDRLRALVPEAIATLEKAMKQGSVRAAVELLKIVQLHGQIPAPQGPEDPQLVLWHQAEQWARVEQAREGPHDEAMAWNDQVYQRITLTQHRVGELLSQWTTNGSTPGV
jgi:hypothetical protein